MPRLIREESVYRDPLSGAVCVGKLDLVRKEVQNEFALALAHHYGSTVAAPILPEHVVMIQAGHSSFTNLEAHMLIFPGD